MALPKKNRLIRKKDIDALFRQKNALKGDFLFIKYIKNDKLDLRFVSLVPAKIYSRAVDRNRIRRVISEIVSANLNSINSGYDIVAVIKKRGHEDDVKKELLTLLSRSKILWKDS